MDLIISWLPLIGSILLGGLAGNAWYGGDKSLSVWFAFAGVVCLLLLLTLQIQKAISQSSTESKSSPSETAAIKMDGGTLHSEGNLFTGGWDNGILGKNATITSKNDTFIKTGQEAFSVPPPTGEFSKLSDAEIKKRVTLLASDIRASENKHNQEISNLLLGNRTLGGHELGEESIKLYNARNNEFKTLFLPSAVSLTSEMLFRLGGVTTPSNMSGGLILVHGNLAGINPMSQVADFLEYLAEKLPVNNDSQNGALKVGKDSAGVGAQAEVSGSIRQSVTINAPNAIGNQNAANITNIINPQPPISSAEKLGLYIECQHQELPARMPLDERVRYINFRWECLDEVQLHQKEA